MSTVAWNSVYAKLHTENERQIRFYRTCTWLAPSVYLLIAAGLWLVPLDEIKPFSYLVAAASVIFACTNGWTWLRYATRPLSIVEGTFYEKLTERDGGKGSTAKKYFLRLQAYTVYELTPQGQGTMRSSGKKIKIRCSKDLSSDMADGAAVRLLLLSGGFAIGYIKNETAFYPPFAVSFVQSVLSVFFQMRQERQS